MLARWPPRRPASTHEPRSSPPGFEKVGEVADRTLRRSGGGALCVYHRGRPVIDLWAGLADPGTGRAVEPRHDGDGVGRRPRASPRRCSTCWPTGGRSTSTPRSPVTGPSSPRRARIGSRFASSWRWRPACTTCVTSSTTPRLLLDHDAMAAALAAAAPLHQPGEANAYHALTYGWPPAELVRRITGDTLGGVRAAGAGGPARPRRLPHRHPHDRAPPGGGPASAPARAPGRACCREGCSTRSAGGSVSAQPRFAAAFLPRSGARGHGHPGLPAGRGTGGQRCVHGPVAGPDLRRARVGRRARRGAALVAGGSWPGRHGAEPSTGSGPRDQDAMAARLSPALPQPSPLTGDLRFLRGVRIGGLCRPGPGPRCRLRGPGGPGGCRYFGWPP